MQTARSKTRAAAAEGSANDTAKWGLRIAANDTVKWSWQIAEVIFQTRANSSSAF